MKKRERLLFQEVEELTQLLRNDKDWDHIRRFVIEQGLDPKHVLLAGFCEDEEMGEYGCIITQGGTIFHYERLLDEHPEGPKTLVWEERTVEQAMKDSPAVEAAIRIMASS